VADYPAKLAKSPLAFGMWQWGPLPGSAGLCLFWEGAGSGLELHREGGKHMRPVEHQAGRGPFTTVKQADAAAQALYADWRKETEAEEMREAVIAELARYPDGARGPSAAELRDAMDGPDVAGLARAVGILERDGLVEKHRMQGAWRFGLTKQGREQP
jgi:hypothetical protein